jgi:hypothetical protein
MAWVSQPLDRGFQATEVLTRTNDEVASGIAIPPYLFRLTSL